LKDQAFAIAQEGDAIERDQQNLQARRSALDRERAQIPVEYQQLLGQMASALVALLDAPPPLVQQATGGDPVRPPGPVSRGDGAAQTGGDSVSRAADDAALDAYARDHGVDVDKQPVTAVLTPDAIGRLSPAESSDLQLRQTFGGLVAKPNGHYKALTTGEPNAPYLTAIQRGGQGIAQRDGEKIVIDEVEVLPEPPAPRTRAPVPAPPDFAPAEGEYEVFYRAMSKAELDSFVTRGIHPKNGESFVTRELGYIRDRIPQSRAGAYDVLVTLYTHNGTEQLLRDNGGRDEPPSRELLRRGLEQLPALRKGNFEQVHVKTEADEFLTYGLRGKGKGSADLFSRQIVYYTVGELP
jgi:hypothetical protein